ncbi:MAG TPA: FAD-dependent oxidoreductase, partial [Ktedonobacteraceae bacterium]
TDSQADAHIMQQIPWWGDLDAGTHAALELPDISTLPAQTVDVLVIGGGVAGLSAALSAGKAGAQVRVLEAAPMLGWGATGRNAGILSAGINMHLTDLDAAGPEAAFWPETTQMLLSLVNEAARPGAMLSARLTGALSLAESAHAARRLAREARARQAAGLRAEMWTPAQVSELTQGRLNTEQVVSALWLPNEGRIQPLTLLAHLAQQARSEGVVIAGRAFVDTYQEIQGIMDSHYWQISLANGAIITARGLIRTVGPTAQPNQRIYALAFAADLPDSFPLFWDASPYTYADFRPGNGRLTVSGGRYGKAGVTRRDTTYHKRLADAARHWLPELEGKEPGYTWGVDLAVTPDMIPTLRDVGAARSAQFIAPGYTIEGLGALGVLPGIVLGQRAGREIAARLSR